MKIAGIVTDNYKVDRYKRELSNNGFTFECVPFIDECTTIRVNVPPGDSWK